MLGHLFQERRIAGLEMAASGRCLEPIEPRTGQLFEPFEPFVKRLQPSLQLIEPRRAVVDRAAVMACQEEGPQRVGVVLFEQVAHQNDRPRV